MRSMAGCAMNGVSKSRVSSLFLLLAASASGCGPYRDTRDSWEATVNGARESCVRVDDASIVPVTGVRRPDAISRLRDQSSIPLHDEDVASWAGQAPKTPSDPSLKPYLVRAVSMNASGHFYVRSCKEVLEIMQGSLGRSAPPPDRFPLVIYLDHAPTQLDISWTQAE